ncbi:MAG: triphosphoribosyl-dephospho-CoA synthase [Planctomycetota bacterium]
MAVCVEDWQRQDLTLAESVELACILEATAPKAGNVHPGASFSDMSYQHFVASAAALASVIGEVDPPQTVGQIVLACVKATQEAVGRNTNLGTILLFGPLVKAASTEATPVPSIEMLRDNVEQVISELTAQDSADVYEAIVESKPGGMGEQAENDIRSSSPDDLVEAMAQVAEFDAVARQYTNGFADCFEKLIPWLQESLSAFGNLPAPDRILEAICWTQLRWLAHEPDGLIHRKVGAEQAREVQQRAKDVLDDLTCSGRGYESSSHTPATLPLSNQESYKEFDRYLRSDGNRLNPGTTADLIAATLLIFLLTKN